MWILRARVAAGGEKEKGGAEQAEASFHPVSGPHVAMPCKQDHRTRANRPSGRLTCQRSKPETVSASRADGSRHQGPFWPRPPLASNSQTFRGELPPPYPPAAKPLGGDADGQRHIGPVAEDFHEAFGLSDPKSISGSDARGITFAAIQGLHQIVREKDAEIAELQAANEQFAVRLAKLEEQLAKGR